MHTSIRSRAVVISGYTFEACVFGAELVQSGVGEVDVLVAVVVEVVVLATVVEVDVHGSSWEVVVHGVGRGTRDLGDGSCTRFS